MRQVAFTPTLEAKTSTGKDKFWLCRIVADDDGYYLQSESWQGTNGARAFGESKHVLSEPSKIEPKNLGKKNATTALEQATAEMASKFERQKDKGYHERGDDRVSTFTLPMLAHSLAKKLHTVSFPVFMQPKYNGIRCLYNSRIGFWSRQGNELIKEVTAHLRHDTQGETIDGELILPAPYTFQQTISAIKKFDAGLSPKLIYRVYDIAKEKTTFIQRWALLKTIAEAQPNKSWYVSATDVANDPDDITKLHHSYVKGGFEGSIIRKPQGLYAAGQRSDSLLKHKDMVDAEFEITGFEEGVGKDKGLIIFVCKAANGRPFNVRPEGTAKMREQMFKAGKTYIGAKLTVRYQNLTDDGVPLFPVGVTVRDYE